MSGSRHVASGMLIAALGLMTLLLAVSGRFTPRLQPDTQAYRNVDLSSLHAALSHTRTVGYPMLLRTSSWIAANDRAVPYVQWSLHAAGVIVLFAGLRAAGFRGSVALAAALPLVFSRPVLEFIPQLTGDGPALSLALAAAGCLFLLLAGRRRTAALLGLSVTTFLAYQIRPAYLFTVVLWPCLAGLLSALVLQRSASRTRWMREVALVTLAALLPLVLFCGLRGLLLGHFGLVSFGGYNIVGIAGQLMDEQTVEQLPQDVRPLARSIIAQRNGLPQYEPPRDFATMERLYNDVIWRVAVPTAEQRSAGDRVAANAALSRLSRAVLLHHRRDYARWLLASARHAVHQVMTVLLLDPGTVLVVLVLLVTHAVRLVRGPRALVEPTPAELARTQFVERHLLIWTALAFAAAKILLVILVEPAIGRYMTAAAALIPAALGARAASYEKVESRK